MEFAGVNYVAILIAAVAGFLIGWPWYRAFGRAWAQAAGLDPETAAEPGPRPFLILALSQLLMAGMLAGVIGHLGKGQVTLLNGVISGAFIWVGFVATTLATNYAFQRRPAALALIDGGYYLAVLIVQGAIIGALGV
ncbi:MAG: DUF1761 domain-containing protein [Alphaproteobacteria bacterium]|nr:MAG: DUF1761 domain-containing protein [Alphaproteobacteria bacterium]